MCADSHGHIDIMLMLILEHHNDTQHDESNDDGNL